MEREAATGTAAAGDGTLRAAASASAGGAPAAPAAGAVTSAAASPAPTATPIAAPAAPADPFIRAENEDDDGYDPYSDRLPAPEPLFERDPWG